MIQLSDSELSAFRRRCEQAARNGYRIAHGSEYADVLMGELGISEVPNGMKKGSSAHLSHLAGAVQVHRLAPPPEPKPGLVSLKSDPAPDPPKSEAPPSIDLHKEVPISELKLDDAALKAAEEVLLTVEVEPKVDLHAEVPISNLALPASEETTEETTAEEESTESPATEEEAASKAEPAQEASTSKKGRRRGR